MGKKSKPFIDDDENLSILISAILRHKPQIINATVDRYGFMSTDILINGVNSKGYITDLERIKRIVKEDDKKRYKLIEEDTLIRANQGHSFPVDLGLPPIKPLDVLYHGTATRFIDSIFEKGIMKMNREDVHLSADIETAVNVGKRHGQPIVLIVDSKKMHEDKYEFRLSENGVWLTDYVPTKYFKILNN